MALQLASEGGDEVRERSAPFLLDPVLEFGKSCTELLAVGATFDPPIVGIAPASVPIEVEAQEGELPAALRLPPVDLYDQRTL